jgi:prepilin-type N-terminal cleavage/methylation domain-containing protein
MRARPFRSRRDEGFTLAETLVAMVVAAIALAIFAGFYPPAVETIQGDADMRILYWQLKLARETAINERRAVELQFVPPNLLRLVRQNMPNGTTVISTAALEHQAQFMLFAGQPDTPDAFGRPGPIAFNGVAAPRFTSDGMLTDAAGNPVNGTVFIGQVGKPMTSRAITIFGTTATIRSYRWNGTQWRP